MQSLISRRSLEGNLDFYGMFCQEDAPRTQGTGSVSEADGALAGIITLGGDGRSTVLGGGPEWAPLVAGLFRERVTGGWTCSSPARRHFFCPQGFLL